MQKFLFKTFVFLIILVILDFIFGLLFAYLVKHAKGGDNWRNNFICNRVSDDLLIFGSSRAVHHYNPIILSDSLNLSCYNCGQGGNGAILHEARFHLILQRYNPKVVVYDVFPEFDLIGGEDNHKYLRYLKAYYEKPGVPEVFESVDDVEKYKMLSQMYRYNSNCIQIISDYVYPLKSKGIKGFRPMNEKLDTMKVRKVEIKHTTPMFDSLKIRYVRKMVDESIDTKIIFVASPWWNGTDTMQYMPIYELCNEKNIPFLDFSNNPKYVHNNSYFKDGKHLNARGADEFTKDLASELRRRKLLE